MEEAPSTTLFPEILLADLLVTGISELEDLRKNFLFCLDFSLRGLLTYSVKLSWPFNSLLIPLSYSGTGIRGILLVKSKKRDLEEFVLKAENFIKKLSFKRIVMIPHWSGCFLENSSKDFKAMLDEVSYRSGCEITIFFGGNDE